jgi:hypothetical protein
MADIQSKRLIVIKGLLFIFIAIVCAVAIVGYNPSPTVVALVLILIWSSARSYYFLFYVLEKYVDPNLKYAGIIDLIRKARRNDLKKTG